MKKHLIFLTSISLLFFSCASKPETSEEIPEIAAPVKETETEIPEITPPSSDQYDELEEIEEPEVTDLEWVEEVQEDNSTENTETTDDSEKEYELVAPEEVLTQTETIAEEDKTKTELEITAKENVTDATSKDKGNKKTGNSGDDEVIDLTNNNSPEDIIEILDEFSDAAPEEAEPVIIIPSRKVTLKIGQTLEVMYPGTGWIYMGTTDSTKDFTFLGKKLGTQNTKFTFTAKAEGSKILHFYKNDTLTNNYIDDYLEVEITAQKDTSKTTVSAPAYKQPVPVKPSVKVTEEKQPETKTPETSNTDNTKKTENTTSTVAKTTTPSVTSPKVETVKETPKATAPVTTKTTETKETVQEVPAVNATETTEIDTATLLKEANSSFDSKDYSKALNKILQFLEYSTKNRDEALYLQGQIYEAESPLKNIKKAIECYTAITKSYPASPYWDKANKRIIYLTKFYLEGR